MKKLLYLTVAFLGTIGLFAQDLMIVNNTSAPMNGSIRLHNKFDDPHPELGDINMAIPPAGNIWIFDFPQDQNLIPFSAINNPAATFYTPIFSVTGGGSVSTGELINCCTAKFKWSCIKTDILSYFDFQSPINTSGYIQISPPYDSSMGPYTTTSWSGYVALNSTGEVFEHNHGYDYNEGPYNLDPMSPNTPTGMEFVEITSGTSPFGGYMVVVDMY